MIKKLIFPITALATLSYSAAIFLTINPLKILEIETSKRLKKLSKKLEKLKDNPWVEILDECKVHESETSFKSDLKVGILSKEMESEISKMGMDGNLVYATETCSSDKTLNSALLEIVESLKNKKINKQKIQK